MNASKFLISSAAVVAVIGGIGFSYAQSGDNAVKPKGAPGTSDMQNPSGTPGQSTPSNPGMQNQPSDRPSASTSRDATGSMNRDSTGTMSSERMARADRN